MTPFLDGAKILQPTLFIAGDKDAVIEFHRTEFEVLERNIPNLRKKMLLAGVGHWTQQESPDDVSRLLIEFLDSVRSALP
jgi:pimeloyl-ACP methyl ester carboxylesterase